MDFIDLKTQYEIIKNPLKKRLDSIFQRAGFILGPEIVELEEKLAAYVGKKFCLTCSSGTDALLLALMAKGVGPGDAVFTSTFTFFATAEVISLLGATPVFVDIDPKTYNIDPKKLRDEIAKIKNAEEITPPFPRNLKPKAIIPVDLFGICADYQEIDSIAQEFGLFVLEDAAQSFGAIYRGRKACSFGDIAATSFFPAKPLGCYGDGGAVFCDDPEMIEILKSLRVHGQGADKYENVRIGINGRMDTIQAAVLLEKMEIFEDEIHKRQIVAQRYADGLANKVIVPHVPQGMRSAWAQYSVQTENREHTISSLKKAGIPTAIYYPIPLHLQKAFAYLGNEKGLCPVAEAAAEKIFSLPMYPYLEGKDQDLIIKTLLGV
jgi:UDP-2-acetamido-2-deoxy-ribo-hexuluronate aminotransferase